MVDTSAVDNPLARRTRNRRLWPIVVAVLLLIAVVGAASLVWLQNWLDPGTAVAGVSAVAVRDNDFAPAAIEVRAGTTVTWRWEGVELHNVVGDGFESPTQVDGEFAQTFDAAGTYAYRCTLHFLMRGEVVVTE